MQLIIAIPETKPNPTFNLSNEKEKFWLFLKFCLKQQQKKLSDTCVDIWIS